MECPGIVLVILYVCIGLLFSYYIWGKNKRGKEASAYCAPTMPQALRRLGVAYPCGADLSAVFKCNLQGSHVMYSMFEK